MNRLRPELIRELTEVALALSLHQRRQVLLLGIPGAFQGSMPPGSSPGDQLRLDLNWLNDAGFLTDGTDPLKRWLTNAVDATGGVEDARLFQRAIDELDQAARGAANPSWRPPGWTDARPQLPANSRVEGITESGNRSSAQAIGQGSEFVSVAVRWLEAETLSVTVTRWLKQPGDRVQEDEPLLEISTDKVDLEIPSPATGYLRYIYIPQNETAKVGERLAIIEKD